MHTPRRYDGRHSVLQNGTDIRDDHARMLYVRRYTFLRVFTRFLNFSVHGLTLLYAREFRPPNIYLLVVFDGCMYDIS